MKLLSLIILSLLFCVPTSHANETTQNGTQLILLGTAGGPSTKRNRSQPANAVVVNGDIYILDAGDGVARQLTLAGFSVAGVKMLVLSHFAGSGLPLYDRREVWAGAVRKTYSGPLIVGENLTIIE